MLYFYNESYRELLNKWQFWEVRAIYDNLYQKLRKSTIDKTVRTSESDPLNLGKFQSMELLCNNCGKNILEKMKNRINSSNSSTSTTFPLSRTDVIMGCSECSKFLPQCAICLQIMTINPSTLLAAYNSLVLHKQSINSTSNNNSSHSSSTRSPNTSHNDDNYNFLINNKFGNQYSSCMNCKHGGHLKHLIEWFKIETRCPVPHCKCNCLKIDIV